MIILSSKSLRKISIKRTEFNLNGLFNDQLVKCLKYRDIYK